MTISGESDFNEALTIAEQYDRKSLKIFLIRGGIEQAQQAVWCFEQIKVCRVQFCPCRQIVMPIVCHGKAVLHRSSARPIRMMSYLIQPCHLNQPNRLNLFVFKFNALYFSI